jgi:imidazolonepropionase-like amidohydrolase
LLGTDAPNPFVVPGFSIHEELARLVAAGLTPYEAIRTGTTDAAEYLDDDFGVVAPGKRADLLLLDADPLADVRNIARREGVMVRGRWLRDTQLRESLEGVAF